MAATTDDKTEEALRKELVRLVERMGSLGMDRDIVAWHARKCAELLLMLQCKKHPDGIPQGLEDKFDRLKKNSGLSKLDLADYDYIQKQGNAGAHAQRSAEDDDIVKPAVVIQHLCQCVERLLPDPPDRSTGDLQRCLAILTSLKEEFEHGRIQSPTDLKKAVQELRAANAVLRAEIEEERTATRELRRDPGPPAVVLPGAPIAAAASAPSVRAHAQAISDSENRAPEASAMAEPPPDTERTANATARRRPLAAYPVVILGAALLLGVTAVVLWVGQSREPPVGIGDTPSVPASFLPPPEQLPDRSASPSLPTGATGAPIMVTLPAEPSALAATVGALEVATPTARWRVDLHEPLEQVTRDAEAHEVSTPDGIHIRLYACSKDKWVSHRDRPDYKLSHVDDLSFTLNGKEGPSLFDETCLVGMRGPHICLRVLYRSGQDRAGDEWLRRLGKPTKEE